MRFKKKDEVFISKKGIEQACEFTNSQFFNCLDGVKGVIEAIDKDPYEDYPWYLVNFTEINLKYWLEESVLKKER